MTYPSRVITDIVFIPIYFVLLLGSIFNTIKHGRGKRSGFIFLAIFSIVRFIGNILLVVAYKQSYDNLDIAKGGFICQGLGYTFLLNATLSFLQRAKYPDAPSSGGFGLRSLTTRTGPVKILHILTIVGLILLIIGYVDSTDIFPNPSNGFSAADSSNATLNVKAKVGDVIFLVVTVIIAAVVFTSITSSVSLESRRLFQFILVALPIMLARIIYVTYETFTTSPVDRTLWPRIVFEFVAEVVVVLVYFVMGFFVHKAYLDDQQYMASESAAATQHKSVEDGIASS